MRATEARPRTRPFDPRLLRYASAARGYMITTVALGLAGAGLILAQAGLLAHALAAAATGTGVAALAGTLIVLAIVLLARAAASYGGEVTALRAAAAVKSQLRVRLIDRALALGPGWLGGQQGGGEQSGELATLATRGLDGLDAYFARYLPQLVLACLVPLAVLIRVAIADWLSAVHRGHPARRAGLRDPGRPAHERPDPAAVGPARPAGRAFPRRRGGPADTAGLRARPGPGSDHRRADRQVPRGHDGHAAHRVPVGVRPGAGGYPRDGAGRRRGGPAPARRSPGL